MKKLIDFGLEKVPTEALLSIARQENGALKAYITELEDKLDATEKELKSLKAFVESDLYTLTKEEKKAAAEKLRMDKRFQDMKGANTALSKTVKEMKDLNNNLMSRQNAYIRKLESMLAEKGIEILNGGK